MISYGNKKKNINITADRIYIGDKVQLGKNISINVRGEFKLGSYSRLGDDVNIRGNNVCFGEHLYHSFGLRVGGGGSGGPYANLCIGDRCTIHNNIINIAKPVNIGHNVGLSEEVTLLTHGYWLSVLDGYPASFEGITIGSGAIIGYRSLIMMGVNIACNAVVGAQSVVTKSLPFGNAVYAGSPAKLIRGVLPLGIKEKMEKIDKILSDYADIADYHGFDYHTTTVYPLVFYHDFVFDVETFRYDGEEDEATDCLRDHFRRWGIRIYTKRPFASKFNSKISLKDMIDVL